MKTEYRIVKNPANKQSNFNLLKKCVKDIICPHVHVILHG